ncbi:SPOR domain-containing protein [Loktanella sp. Alg231-35]|uniref:SPOR domain-containing protein n=1 Tax=Loktanella sp. Alg231-35 TaxID=1922220 RepID=UPI000D54B3EF|nr:SPOR domain-containing protein [Loktanella sp. Alg231-35]
MAVYDQGFAPAAGVPRVTNLVNFAGAAMSLALILGVGFWGYKLIVRDVSGIPVVRAMEGDMRVLPDNPGGAVAAHTGLAVNEVAASGEAGAPEDTLVLAPRTAGLAAEDLEAQPVAATPAAAPVVENAVPADEIAALAAQLASIAPATTPESTPAAVNPDAIPATVPGVAASPRPTVRPARFQVPATTATPSNEVAVTTTSFPTGTDLVQLGAFQSPTLAAQEWERLQSRFGQLIADRAHFIEVSNQSGGTWYRLRASGFDDRADARRLCAALQAEGANCIAVVVN